MKPENFKVIIKVTEVYIEAWWVRANSPAEATKKAMKNWIDDNSRGEYLENLSCDAEVCGIEEVEI